MDREIDEVFIDLMAAVMLYIQVKDQAKNPFVKSFKGVMKEDEALLYLIQCLDNCQPYFPLIEQLNQQRLAEIED